MQADSEGVRYRGLIETKCRAASSTHLLAVLRSEERVCGTGGASTAGTTDLVDVVLSVVREIIVDDFKNVRVDAACAKEKRVSYAVRTAKKEPKEGQNLNSPYLISLTSLGGKSSKSS